MTEGAEATDKVLIQQLPRRGISSVVYTLKVPNVFTLAEYNNTTSELLYSPTFEFVNSIFRFRIEFGNNQVFKCFVVYLERICFKKLKLRIFYELQSLDGEYEICDVCTLGSVKDEVDLFELIDKNSTHNKRDVFTLTVYLIYVESTEREEDPILMRTSTRELTEKVRDEKIVIHQLSIRKISSVVYTLKAPNVFILAEFDNKVSKLYSAKFEFINTTWRFRAEPYIDKENKRLEIYLERINFKKRKQRIFCEIMLNVEDEVHDYNTNMEIFEDHEDELYLHSFTNSDSSHDKRDVLTLTVHIVYVEPTEKEEDQVLMRRSVLSLRDDFKSMLLNGEDHNVTFTVSGKNFRAHQDVLRARSDVFRSMLTHDMLEKNKGVIDVPDIDPEAFEQLLFYIYTGKTETLDETNVFGLYYAADKYNLAVLKEECCKFIMKSLTDTNVCDALNLATKHSDEGLLNSAMNYFFSNVDDILLTVEWKLFMRDNSTVANELFIKSLKKIRDAQAS